jgi:hypothetical protein
MQVYSDCEEITNFIQEMNENGIEEECTKYLKI